MPTTNFVWDYVNDSYLAEVDESGTATAVYTNEPVHFGKVISQNRSGMASYFHVDAQRSMRQLTSQSQFVTDEYKFSAYGETIAANGSTGNTFKYVGTYGYYSDTESNQIYVRARDYAPSLNRWSSSDPIAFDNGQWNLYQYVANSPTHAIDPSGQIAWIPVACVVTIACIGIPFFDCSGACAIDPIWDNLNDDWGSCTNKCVKAILKSKHICASAYSASCMSALATCTVGAAGKWAVEHAGPPTKNPWPQIDVRGERIIR